MPCRTLIFEKYMYSLISRVYAESVEKKLKSHGLVVECAHLPETVPLLDELEDASKRGVLFGIIISSQHEVHRSVTVHILHGTQQGKFSSHVNFMQANLFIPGLNILIQCMNERQKLLYYMSKLSGSSECICSHFGERHCCREFLSMWGISVGVPHNNTVVALSPPLNFAVLAK